MKRLSIVACALSLFVVGCDEKLSPVAPAGRVNFVAQMSATQEVPPVTVLEGAAAGGASVTMTPTGTGAYSLDITFQLGGFLRPLPIPGLENGTAIVAGHIHQGAAGTNGPVVVPFPISLAGPILTPTGTVLLTLTGIPVTAAVGQAILANPSGFYVNLHSGVNPGGVVRGQLIRQ